MPHTLNDLAPASILIAVATLIVTMAWHEVFNTVFNYIAVTYYNMDNGPQEIAMRVSYALLVTVLAAVVLRRFLTLGLLVIPDQAATKSQQKPSSSSLAHRMQRTLDRRRR